MKRWNGWGDAFYNYPLAANARAYLEQKLKPAIPPKDATLEEVLCKISPSRLKQNHLWSTSSLHRFQVARGQSFPDWVALRFGTIDQVPDAVAVPYDTEAVKTLVDYAKSNDVVLIPYGGGTSVVGHINPLPDERPILTVNMLRLTQLLDFNTKNLTACFGAGITGSLLEANLRARGFTLGHYPQSFEYSTLGGWIATRSSGQQSLYYGRMEQLFGGGNVMTPQGLLPIPFFPASAAGFDLREAVLGSEGRLGIITDAIVKISPIPREESFFAVFFPTWEEGVCAVRSIVQNKLPVSMLRLSDALETGANLALVPPNPLMGCLKLYLSWRNCKDEKCILIVGVTGETPGEAQNTSAIVLATTHSHHGIYLGKGIGRRWEHHRFRTPYLRNTLWSLGYGVDALETAVAWSSVTRMKEAITTALHQALEKYDESVLAMTHLSQVYPQGSSVYVTFIYRLAESAEENLARWGAMKAAATRAIQQVGGTISHQHGVGIDHRPYLLAEKSALGLSALQTLCKAFDPSGMMNPGKLV